jgi:hypothetical protein
MVVNNQRMTNYLTTQGKIVNAQTKQAEYSNVSSTVSTSSGGSSYGSIQGSQSVVGPYNPVQMTPYQQYSSAPTTRSLNTNTITENNAKRNVRFTEQENSKMSSSVSAASHIADQYERYQSELQQLQQTTEQARAQTIETTKQALYNQREAFKKRLIEAAQKLLQTVAIIKRMETELEMNAKTRGRVPYAIGRIFGR